MVTGATSLSMVRDELFTTMAETQQNLERFLEERDSGTLLQVSVSKLQQIKGIMSLIELTGAEMLAQEMQSLATDIPAGADEQSNEQLAAINNGLHVLQSYLEQLEENWVEMPELLLPAINQLRIASLQSKLPESFFFSTKLNVQRPAREPLKTVKQLPLALSRLRQMYQLALLSLLKGEQPTPHLERMQRIMQHLDEIEPNAETVNVYWIAAAAFESMIDGKLLVKPERKLLFSRLDRELKHYAHTPGHTTPRGIIKDLLYLVALANSHGPLATEVRQAANLPGLPFTDHMLEEEYQRLSGPDAHALRSLSTAIGEELGVVKDTLDLVGRGTVSTEAFESLPVMVGKLEKTLTMVGLSGASLALKRQLSVLSGWKSIDDVERDQLLELADAVIYVEGLVASLERGKRHAAQVSELSEAEVFAKHQLAEAQIVIKGEAKSGINLAKRGVTAYFESKGDKNHLVNVPDALTNVRGGLWFVDEFKAADLIQACADYIDNQLLTASSVPSETILSNLADALASLEFYFEGGDSLQRHEEKNVLEMAADSLMALGVKLADEH